MDRQLERPDHVYPTKSSQSRGRPALNPSLPPQMRRRHQTSLSRIATSSTAARYQLVLIRYMHYTNFHAHSLATQSEQRRHTLFSRTRELSSLSNIQCTLCIAFGIVFKTRSSCTYIYSLDLQTSRAASRTVRPMGIGIRLVEND